MVYSVDDRPTERWTGHLPREILKRDGKKRKEGRKEAVIMNEGLWQEPLVSAAENEPESRRHELGAESSFSNLMPRARRQPEGNAWMAG